MSSFLFVSTYDLRRNTSGNIRTVALMNALQKQGHSVDCIFVPKDSPSDKNIYENLIKINKLFTYPKSDLSFIEKKAPSGKGEISALHFFRRYLIQMFTSLSVYDVFGLILGKLRRKDLACLRDSYDYIISSSEPRSSHKFAEKIIKLKGYSAKWILYWGDPMTNDVASTKLFRNSESKEEQRLLSVSDFSLYTNPCAAAYMKKKYPKHARKIDWIPTSDFEKDEQASELEVDTNCIGYFGDYRQMYRNIYPFYEACIENNISAIIVGDGDTQLLSQNNVKVHPRMTRNELEAYEKQCGILLVLENFTKTGECIQVPGKLYHYGLTHKHILVITESSNISKDYEEYHRFVFVPNDKGRIIDAIKRIQKGDISNCSNDPVEDFKNENIARLFEAKINTLRK